MTKDIKLFPLFLIFFGVFLRLVPHPANFAPITAIALFSAVYLPKKYAFSLPLIAVFISDLFIGFYGPTMVWVYASFLLSALIGLWLKSHKNPATILASSLVASILFFLITNFAVWLEPQSWYPKNLNGLLQSYTAGLPFFRNTLLGDIFYTGTFFIIYELALKFSKKILPTKLLKISF